MSGELVGDIRDEYDLPEEKGGERTERAAFVNGVATIEGNGNAAGKGHHLYTHSA